MDHLDERQALITCVKNMNRLGINHGTSGNASVRVDGGYLITPSGMAYDDLKPEDIVRKTFEGTFCSPNGLRKPSSEWRFHEDILSSRTDVNAIVHTHGTGVMTIACLNQDIPPFHYMIAVAGGDTIRCAPYRTFGTQELSDVALDALQNRKACLLSNHGQIALGSSLQQALSIAQEVEILCDVYWRTLQAGGPSILTDDQMNDALEQFKGYGANAQTDR